MFCSCKQQQVGGAYDLKKGTQTKLSFTPLDASEHRDPGACPEGWHGVALAPLLKYDPPPLCVLLKSQSPTTLDDSTSVSRRKNTFTSTFTTVLLSDFGSLYCESNYCILLLHSIYLTEFVNYHFTD